MSDHDVPTVIFYGFCAFIGVLLLLLYGYIVIYTYSYLYSSIKRNRLMRKQGLRIYATLHTFLVGILALLWPIGIPCYIAAKKLYPVVFEPTEVETLPVIIIEEGAEITTISQYRQLADLMRGFEKNIPVTEREDIT